MTDRPKYFDKHPCTGCNTGYGDCAQGAVMSLKCCKNCDHPTRWVAEPWDADDLAEFDAYGEETISVTHRFIKDGDTWRPLYGEDM